jgi:hypothetical protein
MSLLLAQNRHAAAVAAARLLLGDERASLTPTRRAQRPPSVKSLVQHIAILFVEKLVNPGVTHED